MFAEKKLGYIKLKNELLASDFSLCDSTSYLKQDTASIHLNKNTNHLEIKNYRNQVTGRKIFNDVNLLFETKEHI